MRRYQVRIMTASDFFNIRGSNTILHRLHYRENRKRSVFKRCSHFLQIMVSESRSILLYEADRDPARNQVLLVTTVVPKFPTFFHKIGQQSVEFKTG